ncbi:MAG: YhgE/Pip domain-containing protein [Lachnospiraceae bacterium]|nr:YhgE/Pip domain-containing protein [Lachnospiraceae bacterium]
MKMIKTIFHTDLKHLFKSFFALIIVVGVCFLPALYAWCNIYSNWDPYGNTGNLKMAAVSLDKGYTDDEGVYENAGDDIIAELKENDKIDWQFVDSQEEALAKVEDGTYYGAVVVTEDFSYNMYNVFIEDVEKPQLIFYQNQKKNPVATKISDTVVETLQNNINEKFVKVMTTTIFEDANQLADDIEEDGGIDSLIERMEKVNSELQEYEKTIDGAVAGNQVLSSAISSADKDVDYYEEKAKEGQESLADASDSIEDSQGTLSDYSKEVSLALGSVDNALTKAKSDLEAAILTNDVKAMNEALDKTISDLNQSDKALTALKSSLVSVATDTTGNTTISDTVSTISTLLGITSDMETQIATIQSQLAATTSEEAFSSNQAALIQQLDGLIGFVETMQSKLDKSLIPQLDETLESLSVVITNANTLMTNLSGTLAGMGDIFGALQLTVNSGNQSLLQTKEALAMLSDRLTETIEKVQEASDDEKVEVLMDTLSGNPDIYGEFFSEPVQIESEAIYPVENYGSAVTPFYTVLAIWVGALILTAILKVKPSEDRYPDAKDYELYFGRYLIFFVVGQIQTLIIVLGDLYLLHVQCVHPFLFWVASAITGFVFSLLIYSLVLAFGDVGKALAVVIVVLQIAGSSGTYPIELLPEFFQRVYIFFPFPYGINAMRECIAGFYGHDYVIYLLELGGFVIASLAIGLWIRKPFMPLSHFMEKRMEDTKML